MSHRARNYRKSLQKALLFTAFTAHTALLFTGTAFADLSLKENRTASGNFVHLSDIFTGVTIEADKVIAEAPNPGGEISFSARVLEQTTQESGLIWERPAYLKQVSVTRQGVAFSKDMALQVLQAASSSAGFNGDIRFQIFGSLKNIYLPVDYDPADVYIEDFQPSVRGGRFQAQLSIPDGSGTNISVRLSGKMEQIQMIPVMTRALPAGEIIQAGDLEWTEINTSRVNNSTVQDDIELVGKTPRRTLRPGIMIRKSDIQTPVLIEKGTVVVMAVEVGGVKLTATGRALDDGGMGDTIRLMNPQSKQTVEGKIVSPDRVVVVSSSNLLASR